VTRAEGLVSLDEPVLRILVSIIDCFAIIASLVGFCRGGIDLGENKPPRAVQFAKLPRIRKSEENRSTIDTKLDARSPEGSVFGRSLIMREMRRRLASGCGGGTRCTRLNSRTDTQPVRSRDNSYAQAHAEQSQKNSVLADLRSSAYRSPPFRSLNSSRHLKLTHRLTICIIRKWDLKAQHHVICDKIPLRWGSLLWMLAPAPAGSAAILQMRFQMRSHGLPGVLWP
jgi:hypothetical protein